MPAASADLSRLAADLAAAAGTPLERTAAHLIQKTAQQIQQLAQASAPRKTGTLANSITLRWKGPTAVEIGPTVRYGVFQEFGTGSRGEFPGKPYVIKPKRAPYLVFQVNGRTVVAREVHHPGVRAQPYMRPAALEALDPFAGELAEAGALIITKGPRSTL